MLLSYFTVKVDAALEAANDFIVPWLSDAEELLNEDEVLVSLLPFGCLILRSITSEIKPGFVILLSSTSISPASILTTEGMDGRSFGLS